MNLSKGTNYFSNMYDTKKKPNTLIEKDFPKLSLTKKNLGEDLQRT